MSAKSTVACFNSPQPDDGAAAMEASLGAEANGARGTGTPQPPQKRAAGVQSNPQAAHLYVSALPQFSQ
jgi:hypothetical protein